MTSFFAEHIKGVELTSYLAEQYRRGVEITRYFVQQYRRELN